MRHEIDCRRLLCPMPVIKVQNKVAELHSGDQLEAICSDPGVLQDIPAWTRINGHKVISTEQKEHEYFVLIEVQHTP